MTKNSIAVVGMACRYPDASNVGELWQNALAGRRAFRRMPDERLRLADYFSTDRQATDSFYCTQAAVLDGYTFDRSRFRIAGSTYRQTDLAHWLALDVAAEALADAGFSGQRELPRDRTGVLVGNTLTGEFSRAHVLRLRWPYVRRVLAVSVESLGMSADDRQRLLDDVEERYKAPFPAPDEESLAGGLSNTIAGRICNYFDLHGGGYTVDGACASSLLAIANGCSALAGGDLELAIVGGVDLSLDPFELVGFARNGALAGDEMRVFDRRSNGFWPGEGCGFVVLMREADAVAHGHRIYGAIRGWGISSDGRGGITRPVSAGQQMAFERAYERAGYSARTVGYFEAHGTGTSVGDATELSTLLGVLEKSDGELETAPVVGSVKALIGHTKAAAGIAGFLKAIQVVRHRWLPATVGCSDPHPLLAQSPMLRNLDAAEPWPENRPVRAGVSGMGFGGINVHVALEAVGSAPRRPVRLSSVQRRAARSAQDVELLVFDGADAEELAGRMARARALAPRLSRAQLGDLAGFLAGTQQHRRYRAAVIAATPDQLAERLDEAMEHVRAGNRAPLLGDSVMAGASSESPRIGFLFPGQASPSHLSGGIYRNRFAAVDELYRQFGLDPDSDDSGGVETAVAQPAIVLASVAGLAVLRDVGIEADVALGHSLGELSALHWGGALGGEEVMDLARTRGRAMSQLGDSRGTMAMLSAGADEVTRLINGEKVVVACYNAPRSTVIAGLDEEVAQVLKRGRERNIRAVPLRVSHAFHSPLVQAAAVPLAAHLQSAQLSPLQGNVVSTITGQSLVSTADVPDLLTRQVTEPVRFMEAIGRAADRVSLFLEVGPGRSLGQLASLNTDVPIISLDACGPSLSGLLQAVGTAFVLGADADIEALFADRFVRAMDFDWKLQPLENPCERAPACPGAVVRGSSEAQSASEASGSGPGSQVAENQTAIDTSSPLDVVRGLVAQRAELSPETVLESDRMLDDLHLNSIMVAEIITATARALGVAPPAAPTEFANASLGEIAEAVSSGAAAASEAHTAAVAGVEDWVRVFAIEMRDAPPATPAAPAEQAVSPQGESAATWRIQGHGLDGLEALLSGHFAGGWVVRSDDPVVVLRAARAALADGNDDTRFVLIHGGTGPTGIAKTLHLEAPWVDVTVIEHSGDSISLEQIAAEVAQARGYHEVALGANARRLPQLRHIALAAPDELAGEQTLASGDIVLITGGGKGITAECALALAEDKGVRLAVLGRAAPESDPELKTNLARLRAVTEVVYARADVTDPAAVRQAVERAQSELGGCVRGIVHGASRNVPALIGELEESALAQTLAVKVTGLANILAAIDERELRLLVSFGSIIGRGGMRGEADYAVANESLRALTSQFGSAHPDCKCLTIEWSVWSGTGMGERLGRIDALMREGVMPISIAGGVELFQRLVRSIDELPEAVVVTGRFGAMPTIPAAAPPAELLRFIDDVRVHVPGVELVSQTEVSLRTDPYLADHVFGGQLIIPGVIAFEAMAQAAATLTGERGLPALNDIVFNRPMVVPDDSALAMRVAVLADDDGSISAVVRAADTDFQVDCVRATLHFDDSDEWPAPIEAQWSDGDGIAADEVYGSLLFHDGRFRRISRFHDLSATSCAAIVATPAPRSWFARHLPGRLLLGDATINDAAIHAYQPCIPHRPLLPQSIQKIRWREPSGSAPHVIRAREVDRDGAGVLVDVTIADSGGRVWQVWRGLRLSSVAGARYEGPWNPEFLGNFIVHGVENLIGPRALEVAVETRALRHDPDGRAQAIRRLAGDARVEKRPDGCPELEGDRFISLSYDGDLTVLMTAGSRLGCDLETVVSRSATEWRDLLGSERFALAELLARELERPLPEAATMVWSCHEAIRKADATINAAMCWAARSSDGWTLVTAGPLEAVATVVELASGEQIAIAVAVAAHSGKEKRHAHR